jgi:hypothetical protein
VAGSRCGRLRFPQRRRRVFIVGHLVESQPRWMHRRRGCSRTEHLPVRCRRPQASQRSCPSRGTDVRTSC